MSETVASEQKIDLKAGVNDILAVIDQEREREIITRRFGLYDRRETLEQIGELLGITRERVRQLEKAILSRLRTAAQDGKADAVLALEKSIIRELTEMGRIARVSDLTDSLLGRTSDQRERSHVAFISELAPGLTVINENDNYHHSVGIREYGDEKKIRQEVDAIVAAIKKHGQPITIEELHTQLNYEHPNYVRALATVSKLLAHLKENWGLIKWPTVNPKNIRDKIFVILEENGKPMHFSAIAKSIKDSSFKRKDVTTQAIHNELIKDKRFVLIGRGIYALDTWGFSKGTVADIIADVLRKSAEPLHRDEIVKRVLKSRHVKETTILLNLQSKSEFKRVAKATYTLAPEVKA
ncbi:MAG TPA: sigma factor-like helix-turn-helix DNA-binding protein [Candidatus Saccharibacteria bacterium]|nr:sigma factor-like helix-turn-helix DNA-binding protein [Candidatus Saccharibacteria bacterium]